ncbi:MAG TPA: TSCPD domain-containing protein [Petrimonas sp.]|nr:TSCPD domain-containing protein [Petrimonas sp.]
MTTKKPRPRSLPGVTFEMQTQCGKIYVTITRDGEGRPFEIFARFGKAGGCGAAIFDGLTKILSYALRSGMEPDNIVKAFSGISCHLGGNTCLNAVAEAFNTFHHDSNYV